MVVERMCRRIDAIWKVEHKQIKTYILNTSKKLCILFFFFEYVKYFVLAMKIQVELNPNPGKKLRST